MSQYTEAIAENTDGIVGINPGPASSCHVCRDAHGLAADAPEWEELSDDGHFSAYPCDLCGTLLAGQRYTFHGFVKLLWDQGDREPIHYNGCTDCLVYFANGEEPTTWSAK